MRLILATMLVGLLVVGCSKGPERKSTYPVIGKVTVDGKAEKNIAVRCMKVGGMDKNAPTLSAAFTKDDGSFEMGTYEAGDGVPEGDYVLTFQWGQINAVSMGYGGDKFNGKYADGAKSEFKFKASPDTATDGKIDMGTINLTTK